MLLLRRLNVLCVVAALGLSGCAVPKSAYEVTSLQEDIQAGETQKLNRLLSALDSRDTQVRESAVRALAELAPLSVEPLKATVEKGTGRSGPALLALGLTGDPIHLEFIQPYKRNAKLAAYARQAEQVIEDRIYKSATGAGGLEAMEAYLEFFPEGSNRDEIGLLRQETLAKESFSQLKEAPTLESMRGFLTEYPKTSLTEEVQRMLVTALFAESRTAMEEGRFKEARGFLQEVAALDPRRGADVSKVRAESYLKEGDSLLEQGRTQEAMDALDEATRFPEVRADAERRMAQVLLDEARAALTAGAYADGVEKADRAARFDPSLKSDVDRLKVDYVRRILVLVEAPEGDHNTPITDIMLFGEQAVRPMEEYLATLFAQREYPRIEEVMNVLGVSLMPWRGKPIPTSGDDAPPIAVVRLRDSLGGFIRSGFTTSITEVSRLFSSPDFRSEWQANLDPLDPRRAPLVLRVEQITANYLGLLRLGLGYKALLGESGMEVINGEPLSAERLNVLVRQGDIGANPSALLLTRVQLAGKYASTLGELVRTGRACPAVVLSQAVRAALPPVLPEDWMTLADEVAQASAAANGVCQDPKTGSAAAGQAASILEIDADARQVSLSIFEPQALYVGSGTEEVRTTLEQRTLSQLINLSRLCYGLYPGIDRVTVMVGTVEAGGRFEPQTRFTINQKGFKRLDHDELRRLLGHYGVDQADVLDVRWTRWSGGSQ